MKPMGLEIMSTDHPTRSRSDQRLPSSGDLSPREVALNCKDPFAYHAYRDFNTTLKVLYKSSRLYYQLIEKQIKVPETLLSVNCHVGKNVS